MEREEELRLARSQGYTEACLRILTAMKDVEDCKGSYMYHLVQEILGFAALNGDGPAACRRAVALDLPLPYKAPKAGAT
jgi:hypothetical protein